MSNDNKPAIAATVSEMETAGGPAVVSSKTEPTTAAAPVDGPTEVEWMMACNEIGGPDVAEEIITRAYSIAERPRRTGAAPTDFLHAVLRNSTPLREAAFRALGFIDRETSGGEESYRHLQRALHDECASTPAAPGIDLTPFRELQQQLVSEAGVAEINQLEADSVGFTEPAKRAGLRKKILFDVAARLGIVIDASPKGGSDEASIDNSRRGVSGHVEGEPAGCRELVPLLTRAIDAIEFAAKHQGSISGFSSQMDLAKTLREVVAGRKLPMQATSAEVGE